MFELENILVNMFKAHIYDFKCFISKGSSYTNIIEVHLDCMKPNIAEFMFSFFFDSCDYNCMVW